MDPFIFTSVLDLISSEVPETEKELRELLEQDDGVERVAALVSASGLASLDLKLVAPLVDFAADCQLLAQGANPLAKLPSILRRQARNPQLPLGPLELEASAELVAHYQGKIRARLDDWVHRADADPRVRQMLRGLAQDDADLVRSVLGKILVQVLAETRGITAFAKIVTNPACQGRVQQGLVGAYISMAVMGQFCAGQREHQRTGQLFTVGATALLQDISTWVKPHVYRNDITVHPVRSAQEAEALGFGAQVTDAIARHHTTRAPDGTPIALAAQGGLSPAAAVVVTANLFLETVAEGGQGKSDIQAIKVLNYLAADGFLDPDVVHVLTGLYLSERFALFIRKANEIPEQCQQRASAQPILWNMHGERNPYKFICRNLDCTHIGTQLTGIAQPIPITFEGNEICRVQRGHYRDCVKLTRVLVEVYRDMRELRSK